MEERIRELKSEALRMKEWAQDEFLKLRRNNIKTVDRLIETAEELDKTKERLSAMEDSVTALEKEASDLKSLISNIEGLRRDALDLKRSILGGVISGGVKEQVAESEGSDEKEGRTDGERIEVSDEEKNAAKELFDRLKRENKESGGAEEDNNDAREEKETADAEEEEWDDDDFDMPEFGEDDMDEQTDADEEPEIDSDAQTPDADTDPGEEEKDFGERFRDSIKEANEAEDGKKALFEKLDGIRPKTRGTAEEMGERIAREMTRQADDYAQMTTDRNIGMDEAGRRINMSLEFYKANGI